MEKINILSVDGFEIVNNVIQKFGKIISCKNTVFFTKLNACINENDIVPFCKELAQKLPVGSLDVGIQGDCEKLGYG